jgi:hypothetical protein
LKQASEFLWQFISSSKQCRVKNGLSKEENAQAAKENWALIPVYDLKLKKMLYSVQFLNPAPFTTNNPNACYQQLWNDARQGNKLALKAIQMITKAASGK